jgi:hypothetical protein
MHKQVAPVVVAGQTEPVKQNKQNNQKPSCTRSPDCKCDLCRRWTKAFRKQKRSVIYAGDGLGPMNARPSPDYATFKTGTTQRHARPTSLKQDSDHELHKEVNTLLQSHETKSLETGGSGEPSTLDQPESQNPLCDPNALNEIRTPENNNLGKPAADMGPDMQRYDVGGWNVVGHKSEVAEEERRALQNIRRSQGRPHGGKRAGTGRPKRAHLSRKHKAQSPDLEQESAVECST